MQSSSRVSVTVTAGCRRAASYSGRAKIIDNAVALIHILDIGPRQCQHAHKLQGEAEQLHSICSASVLLFQVALTYLVPIPGLPML